MTEAEKIPNTNQTEIDPLFVKSKVRDYLKSKSCNVSGDITDGSILNGIIIDILDKAIKRANANNRKTVMERDL